MGCITSGGQSFDGPPSGSYVADLYGVTKTAATLEPMEAHPDMSGATAQDIHARSVLFPTGEAQARNEALHQTIEPYHPERAIVGYSTSIPTDDMVRVHGAKNQVGDWATRSADILDGRVAGGVAQRILALPALPSYASSVNLPTGTRVEASRPITDGVRQFNFDGKGHPEWFSNKKELG